MHRLTTSFIAALLILGANRMHGALVAHEPVDYLPTGRDLQHALPAELAT